MTTTYLTPGVYVREEPGGAHPIEGVGTSTAAFVGVATNPDAPTDKAIAVNNWTQFASIFLGEGPLTPLAHAVYGFFLNGGSRCFVVNLGQADRPLSGGGGSGSASGSGSARARRTGLDVLDEVDEVAIVAAPGYTDAASYDALLSHCERLQDRVAILDAPLEVPDTRFLTMVATPPKPDRGRGRASAAPAGGEGATGEAGATSTSGGSGASGSAGATSAGSGASGGGTASGSGSTDDDGLGARQSAYGAYYFPWLEVKDPFTGEQVQVPPSGHMAGIWARTDATRGVHKAPANEVVRGALDLTYRLADAEQGELNSAGVNCIRFFTGEGIKVWGARTTDGSASEWRYLNVRRLFNMIEESIVKNTRWIVFEPNDQTLWKAIRRDISAFLTRLWRDGALMGRSREEAFFVKCDEETNPPDVIDAGQVVTVIGIAPVKPAEFIIFRVSQYAGGAEIETKGGSNG